MRHSWRYFIRDNRPPWMPLVVGIGIITVLEGFWIYFLAEAITHNLQAEAKLSAVRTQRCPSVIPKGPAATAAEGRHSELFQLHSRGPLQCQFELLRLPEKVAASGEFAIPNFS